MARPFTWKEIPTLAVGESTTLFYAKFGEVERKCDAHAKRTGKAFQYSAGDSAVGEKYVSVTRLPDPEPEAA